MSFSCNEDEVSTNNGTSSISVRLMDDPADYDNVFIEVVDVEVKLNDYSNDENGWQSLNPINTGIYDLLELTGGVNVLLVDDFQIPSGTLNEIRLVLGDDNTVVIDGESFLLKTPSAQQSGLKIKVNETLEENISYTFLLDFVVDESIVVAGNSSNIILKPVIRGSIEAKTGTISGQVLPTGIQVEVATEIDGETISTYTNEDGNFMLVGLEEGAYSIIVTPEEASGFTPLVIEDIEVTIGNTTTIETVNFE
ncbi:DUF4382 domain-containing protein [Pontimicrobium aquaticum]|uniref:DUF4382 domain-containing protein n=2 Tax=Pontimicrobium aquaticum TaxID=2565367 RepID=A0A4U0F1D4_9FLAO|nr:DUF4382 domain-containing protein [Pontimicrobium aquaticum]